MAEARKIRRGGAGDVLRILFVGGFIVFVLLPIYWMVATSLKTNKEIRQDATLYPHAPTFNSYILLFKDKGFSSFLTNSIVVTAASVVIAVAFGSLGAYAIAVLVSMTVRCGCARLWHSGKGMGTIISRFAQTFEHP